MHLGSAFQIMDDVLDYTGEPEAIGKNLGDDLAEGKMTLPLIRALAVGSEPDRAIIRHAVEGGRLDDFAPVREALARSGALAYASSRARDEARLAAGALAGIRAGPDARTLLQLATFSADRSF
jgi:octaprenyl-diphosphate synthase